MRYIGSILLSQAGLLLQKLYFLIGLLGQQFLLQTALTIKTLLALTVLLGLFHC